MYTCNIHVYTVGQYKTAILDKILLTSSKT